MNRNRSRWLTYAMWIAIAIYIGIAIYVFWHFGFTKLPPPPI
ncbi:MAG: hypothetical protein BWX50_00572 [Euryarchaeota archaeon ADurb.Bin009]|jgi:hypothetical protein|nr:MAG: hypothetical protein BWX50_00572 [Euryarchaeota archaeon ADurb.Bin009]